MPIDITSRREKTKEVTVNYDGETAKVWYRPGEITPHLSRQLSEQIETTGESYIVALVCKWVKAWELTFDASADPIEPIPLEPEIVGMLETPLLSAVIEAIRDDWQPGKPTNNGSFVG